MDIEQENKMTVYPATWRICTPEQPIFGRVIPLDVQPSTIPGACSNCGNISPGLMFGFCLTENSRHLCYFKIREKEVSYPGWICQSPCPVCGRTGKFYPTGALPKNIYAGLFSNN